MCCANHNFGVGGGLTNKKSLRRNHNIGDKDGWGGDGWYMKMYKQYVQATNSWLRTCNIGDQDGGGGDLEANNPKNPKTKKNYTKTS